jgi:thioester reductase-like protein
MPNRTILLTGATGFLGGALAARWTSTVDALVAVVRAPTTEQARARLAASVARFIGPEPSKTLVAATTVVVGDLADPRIFDLPVFDTVTHVVHSAACTSFTPKRRVWRSNVEGTTLLAELDGVRSVWCSRHRVLRQHAPSVGGLPRAP